MALLTPIRTRPRMDRRSTVWHVDWVLVLCVVALSFLGAMLIWSSTHNRTTLTGGNQYAFLARHALNFAIGLVLAVGAAITDHRRVRILAPVLYAGSIVGLILVLVPGVGSTINGSRSWIQLPGMSIQPSEFAKLAVIVGMALLIAEKGETDRNENARTVDVAQAIGVAAIPVILVMLQPDLGTVMVLGSIVFGIIAVSGVPKRWMLGLLTAGVLVAAIAIELHVLKTYQLERFTAFLHPSTDPQGIGYNVNQARIAIGNGGVFGQGLFHGGQTQNAFVPEQHTDFVFTVAGEELGLIGAGAIIALFAVILFRGLRIAVTARDAFGRLVATGIVCWFAFQAFENIGMTLGIMPVTGLPLPFVSYGGSSMFACLLAVGLLENIHLRSHSY
ncbi:rod shape-determining protein RodA [Kribbella solani]|uniref:peptidoglycan glycosyltransferase n=1 Tax=Kribbella solani TaxID=236067 RepID=A0A841DP39_9ACTN|nr:rod shape-determining protein RodA [Kribbella solani]MBB5979661.1 rod shape determining protein RodA [Kribbella solani]MDX2971041.1 rod shape-determining protein RodA [Kribbella solani]MDX3004666.1 rod shape-determining protein RodA [Kribbella solani]